MKIEDYLISSDTSGDTKRSPCFKYIKNNHKSGEKSGRLLCKVSCPARN